MWVHRSSGTGAIAKVGYEKYNIKSTILKVLIWKCHISHSKEFIQNFVFLKNNFKIHRLK
jgi:hypothetical protein